MLIEILVSALVLIIASAGVMMLLQTTTRSQAELRHNSEAYALAQEDQARLASMRLSTLNRLDQTRTVTLNKTQFSVRSRGVFINDSTSKASCGEGTSSADYVEITSSVSWPGMDPGEKAKIVSVLSPSNGSLDPNRGTVAFSVVTQGQTPLANVYVSGGSGAFAGYTDASGCAVFADLAAGNYTASVNGEALGLVGHDGESTQTEAVPVAGGDTKTVTFEFDRPGTIQVPFKFRVGSSGSYMASSQPAIVAYNQGMKAAKVFWTANGSPEPNVTASNLFPFSSTYFIYAGSCADNNPDEKGEGTNAAATANVAAPANGTASAAPIQLPAYEPLVWSGRNSSNKGSLLSGADVWVRDDSCTKSGQPVTRRYTSNTQGTIDDKGLPWGVYDLCVDTEPGENTSSVRRLRYSNVTIQNLAAPTVREFYLGTGFGSVYESGSCP